jgi:DNA repair protein RadC
MKSSPTLDKSKIESTPHYLGHRGRLRDRFLKAPEALADYEVLELLLGFVNLRKDTKPMAKDLLAKFQTLSRVLSAPSAELLSIKGIAETSMTMFRLVQEIVRRSFKEDLQKKPLMNSIHEVRSYCQTTMSFLTIEQLRVFFLDSRGMLIEEEVHQEGTIDQTALYPREILKKALNKGASSLIIVHNHPSGDATPSPLDIKMTRDLKGACQNLGITLRDHLIIGKFGWTSFQEKGWL